MNTNDEIEKFTDMAADPIRRTIEIAKLSRLTTKLTWCAWGPMLAVIVSSFSSKPMNGGIVFAAAMAWILVFKFDSDLQLLKVIDRLQQGEKKSN